MFLNHIDTKYLGILYSQPSTFQVKNYRREDCRKSYFSDIAK